MQQNHRVRPYSTLFVAVVFLLAAVLLAGCGGGSPTQSAAATSAVQSQASTPNTSTGAATPTVSASPVPTSEATEVPVPDAVEGVVFSLMSYSPDGKLFAFVGTHNDGFGSTTSRLYVKPVDGLEARVIADAQAEILQMAFSPDSASVLLYVEETGWFVAKVAEDNKTPPQQVNAGSGSFVTLCASWSPDSKGLLAVTPTGVNLITVADGSGKKLFSEADETGCAFYSPDGKSIAHLGKKDSSGFPALYVSAPDGSGAKLVSGSNNRGLNYPTWSPDGKYLAYMIEDVNINGNTVCVAAVDGSGSKCLEVQPQDNKIYLYFAWSPDSKKLALVKRSNDLQNAQNVEVMPIDTMKTVALTDYILGVRGVRWTLTGDQILFSAFRPDANGGSIYAINPDGTNLRPVWGQDIVAVSSTLVDFTYPIDSTNTLLFQRPKDWFFDDSQSALVLPFAPSVAALGKTPLPFESRLMIVGGTKNIQGLYHLAVLDSGTPPRGILQSILAMTLSAPDASQIADKALGSNSAAEFIIASTREEVLIVVDVSGYPAVVDLVYPSGQQAHFVALAESIAASMKKG